MCNNYKICHIVTTAYHPQANGQVERMNKTLKDLLSKNTPPKSGDWANYLNSALFVTHVTKQGSTRFTPAELLYGRNLRQNFEFRDDGQEDRNYEDYLLEETQRLKEIWNKAHM